MDATSPRRRAGALDQAPGKRGSAAFRVFMRADTRLKRDPGLAYGFALLAFAAALALRFRADHALPPGFPYLTFFPAVILTTFLCGLWPGVLCATLSGLAAWYFFIPPVNTFVLNSSTALALGFYIFIVTVDIALIHGMSQTTDRLRMAHQLTDRLYGEQRTMFQELQHRVANSMSFVASILYLEKGRVASAPDAARNALDAATTRIESMSRIHRRLYDPSSAELPLDAFLRDLVQDIVAISGSERLQVEVTAEPVQLDLGRMITLALLVSELVTNALKHAFPDGATGKVVVSLTTQEDGLLCLQVSDNGVGLAGAATPAPGGGLGSRIASSLASQLGGKLEVVSDPGVTNRVRFPAGT